MKDSAPMSVLRNSAYAVAYVVGFTLVIPLSLIRGVVVGVISAWTTLD